MLNKKENFIYEAICIKSEDYKEVCDAFMDLIPVIKAECVPKKTIMQRIPPEFDHEEVKFRKEKVIQTLEKFCEIMRSKEQEKCELPIETKVDKNTENLAIRIVFFRIGALSEKFLEKKAEFDLKQPTIFKVYQTLIKRYEASEEKELVISMLMHISQNALGELEFACCDQLILDMRLIPRLCKIQEKEKVFFASILEIYQRILRTKLFLSALMKIADDYRMNNSLAKMVKVF